MDYFHADRLTGHGGDLTGYRTLLLSAEQYRST